VKEVIAVIQMNKMECTRDALAVVGFPAFTVFKAYGRGKQSGLQITYPPEHRNGEADDETEGAAGGKRIKFLPKRLVSVVVEDEFLPAVVAVLMRVNRTGNIGDGRIFVCSVDDAIRIRTGERGKKAIS
jgi:nitrogen regulatory protein PII 2